MYIITVYDTYIHLDGLLKLLQMTTLDMADTLTLTWARYLWATVGPSCRSRTLVLTECSSISCCAIHVLIQYTCRHRRVLSCHTGWQGGQKDVYFRRSIWLKLCKLLTFYYYSTTQCVLLYSICYNELMPCTAIKFGRQYCTACKASVKQGADETPIF